MSEAKVLPFVQPKLDDRPHVHRDRWGKPIIINGELTARGQVRRATCTNCDRQVEGVPYRRATSFIDVLADRSALEKWKMRQVAKGLAMRDAILTGVAAAKDDKRQLDRFCQEAMQAAASSDAATMGTALHQFAEQHDQGQVPLVPPNARRDFVTYIEATKHLAMREIETFVVNDGLQVAGTFDRIVEHDGVRYVADIKTGSIDYDIRKIAMQLQMYGSSKRYNPATGERTPLQVDPDYGLIIHLPAGEARCELVWVNLHEAGAANQLAAEVWSWRSAGAEGVRVDAPQALGSLIAMAGDHATLDGLWFANVHRWNDQLTELAAKRRAELEGRA